MRYGIWDGIWDMGWDLGFGIGIWVYGIGYDTNGIWDFPKSHSKYRADKELRDYKTINNRAAGKMGLHIHYLYDTNVDVIYWRQYYFTA